jgi:hypothetical protein
LVIIAVELGRTAIGGAATSSTSDVQVASVAVAVAENQQKTRRPWTGFALERESGLGLASGCPGILLRSVRSH